METPAAPKTATLGKYKVVRKLGAGSVGVVYEGFDPTLERRVALKTVRKDVLKSGLHDDGIDKILKRFHREALAGARLQHPNIVTVYDFAEQGNTLFIAMELVQGKALKEYFAAKHRFDLKACLNIMSQLLDGLAYSHRHAVVHRDIKPANIILIEDTGQVKIADFGVARIDNSELTHDGEIMGTPSYMAPEQLMGQAVDGRADLFSAGVILYELLTGERPFAGANITALMHNVLSTEPTPATQINSHLPLACEAVLKKALAKTPEDRFQNAEEFKSALTSALNQPAPLPTGEPGKPAASGGGILGDLKKQAAQARLVKEAESARLARLEELYRNDIRPRMLSIHRYLFDLVEQLGVLSWSVEAEYDIPGIGKVDGLAQQNYRVHIDSTDNPKRVVLTFACKAPAERRYAVELSNTDEAQKFFVSQQIKYVEWPSRNALGQIKETLFQARIQVQVAIVCQVDIAKSAIVVHVTNMEGLNQQRYDYRYSEIDEDWLDRLGNFILRKIDTIGKVYITEEERIALRERLAKEKERLQQEAANLPANSDENAHDSEKSSLLRGLREKLFTPNQPR